MKFEIVKLKQLSGKRLTVYSVIIEDEQQTLFDRFLQENISGYHEELGEIRNRLLIMKDKTGIRDDFFDKPEGKLGQDIWAMYDKPQKHLRLYCMQLGHVVIILGGGGPKPKHIRALQEDPKLKYENDLMRMVSDAITQRMRDKEIGWDSSQTELQGDFIFDDDDPMDVQ